MDIFRFPWVLFICTSILQFDFINDMVDRYGIYVTNDLGYVPLVVSTSRSFPNLRITTGFVTRLTRRVPLVEQELVILPEHLSSLKKNREHNGLNKKYKRINNDLQNITQKTRLSNMKTPLKIRWTWVLWMGKQFLFLLMAPRNEMRSHENKLKIYQNNTNNNYKQLDNLNPTKYSTNIQ
jgi:hypothetical protein